MSPAPISFDEYPEWARRELGDDVSSLHAETLYKSAQNTAFLAVLDHPFFIGLPTVLDRASKELDTRFRLLMVADAGEKLELNKKSFESAVNKAYRFNILWNKSYPKPPRDGWLKSSMWFTQLDDILRTRIVCKYVDGPEFLASHLTAFTQHLKLKSRVSSRSLDEGYYAYHFYVQLPVQIPVAAADKTLSESTVDMWIELQLTTQFQDVLYNLTHPVYAATRLMPNVDRQNWKWEYSSRRFSAGYMGHTLHMLEGQIAQMRDSLLAEEKAKAPAPTVDVPSAADPEVATAEHEKDDGE